MSGVDSECVLNWPFNMNSITRKTSKLHVHVVTIRDVCIICTSEFSTCLRVDDVSSDDVSRFMEAVRIARNQVPTPYQ